jgi:hypothetical protein
VRCRSLLKGIPHSHPKGNIYLTYEFPFFFLISFSAL